MAHLRADHGLLTLKCARQAHTSAAWTKTQPNVCRTVSTQGQQSEIPCSTSSTRWDQLSAFSNNAMAMLSEWAPRDWLPVRTSSALTTPGRAKSTLNCSQRSACKTVDASPRVVHGAAPVTHVHSCTGEATEIQHASHEPFTAGQTSPCCVGYVSMFATHRAPVSPAPRGSRSPRRRICSSLAQMARDPLLGRSVSCACTMCCAGSPGSTSSHGSCSSCAFGGCEQRTLQRQRTGRTSRARQQRHFTTGEDGR